MKRLPLYTMLSVLWLSGIFGSCSDDYRFDFEPGIDTNASDSANVTVDTLQGIDVSMYAQARVFPGLPDTLETHIDTVITLDISQEYREAAELGLKATLFSTSERDEDWDIIPQPIYSTGTYAGAGEQICIDIKDNNAWGLSVQIGMQTEDLSSMDSYLREPVVYTCRKLYPGKNYVRFPLGGYVWLIRERNAAGPTDLQVELKNVYSAPDYIAHVTDPSEWKAKVQSTTVPWLELRHDRICLSVERYRMAEYLSRDPDFAGKLDELLDTWGKMMEYVFRFKGLSVNAENVENRIPAFPQRFIFDAQLENSRIVSYANARGVVLLRTTSLYDELMSLDNLWNNNYSIVSYVLGENYQASNETMKSHFEISGLTLASYRIAEDAWMEGKVSDFPASAITTLPVTFKGGECGVLDDALEYAAADSAKWIGGEDWTTEVVPGDKPLFLRMLMLIQLGHYDKIVNGGDGWKVFTELYKSARDQRISSSDISFFFRFVCEYFGQNMLPFFERWGEDVSDRERAFALNYPLLDKQIWTIRPLTKEEQSLDGYDGKDYYIRSDRREWTVVATDSAYTRENNYNGERCMPEVLLDGDKSTYWESYEVETKDKDEYGNRLWDRELPLPYYIVIDTKNAAEVDGIYYASGHISDHISEFEVQACSETGDVSEVLGISEEKWETKATVKLDAVHLYANEQFVPVKLNSRYLRIKISKENLRELPEEEAEREEFTKYHYGRAMELAEFGTYKVYTEEGKSRVGR